MNANWTFQVKVSAQVQLTKLYPVIYFSRKILELEEELKVVGNNMKSLEISEQEVGGVIYNATQTQSDHHSLFHSSAEFGLFGGVKLSNVLLVIAVTTREEARTGHFHSGINDIILLP